MSASNIPGAKVGLGSNRVQMSGWRDNASIMRSQLTSSVVTNSVPITAPVSLTSTDESDVKLSIRRGIKSPPTKPASTAAIAGRQ